MAGFFCIACGRDVELGKACPNCKGTVFSPYTNVGESAAETKVLQKLAQEALTAFAPEKVTRLERIVIALIRSEHRQWEAQAELQEGYAWAIVDRAREFCEAMDRVEIEWRKIKK